MAGFGQTVKKQEEKKEVVKDHTAAPRLVVVLAHLEAELQAMKPVNLTHMFVGIAGFDEHVNRVYWKAYSMSMSKTTLMRNYRYRF